MWLLSEPAAAKYSGTVFHGMSMSTEVVSGDARRQRYSCISQGRSRQLRRAAGQGERQDDLDRDLAETRVSPTSTPRQQNSPRPRQGCTQCPSLFAIPYGKSAVLSVHFMRRQRDVSR